MRLNEKHVGNHGAHSAQGRDKTELPNFFPKIESQLGPAKMKALMSSGQVAFDRELDRAQSQEHGHNQEKSNHSSFP
jgi:hypothetical protein